MRIVYLHQYFNTPKMSGGTRSYEFARRLVSWGHEVHVVTSWRGKADAANWYTSSEDGITVHWLPVPYSNRMTYARRVMAFLKFAICAAHRAAGIPGDVIFATSTPLTIALPGVYAAYRQGRPMVFEVRDLWPSLPIALGALRNPFSRWLALSLERFAYRNASRIVALSPGMAEGIEAMGYPAEAIVVIPNLADLDGLRGSVAKAQRFRADHPELGDAEIILYAGTLGKVNEVGYAVDLAAASRDVSPATLFVVIGDGAERQLVAERARDAGVLGKNFFMYSPLPKERMSEALSTASVALSLCLDLPELEANSANKFFDALASGTPIAVNYGGWQPDVLNRAGAGLKLARDPGIAAGQLRSFLDDRDLVRQTGIRARQLAEAEFSCDMLARRLEKILVDAVNNPAAMPLTTA